MYELSEKLQLDDIDNHFLEMYKHDIACGIYEISYHHSIDRNKARLLCEEYKQKNQVMREWMN